LAALLHDVPVSNPAIVGTGNKQRTAHHRSAAAFAAQYLSERGLGTGSVEQVVHCIEAHRYRDRSVSPETLEARCLYDADKLDSIGAIGVARCFAYAGTQGNRLWKQPWKEILPWPPVETTSADYTPVHEFVYKLSHLLEALHTETARRLGVQRHAFMVAFFTQLDAEMDGRV
jgi:uncharacterized protein